MKQQRPGDQPLPHRGRGPSMHDLVCHDLDTFYIGAAAHQASDDFRARRALGLERYGQLLQADNGRDAKRDLYEELLDAAVYARQVMEEAAEVEREYLRIRLYSPLIRLVIDLRRMRDEAAATPAAAAG